MPRLSLSGIVGNTFGRRITIRGYASYDTIVKCSSSDPSYQRPQEMPHVEEIKHFILNSDNTFSPEVILGYTLPRDLSSGSPEPSSLIENLWKKKTSTFSNKTVKIKYNKTKNECTIAFPSEDSIFRRIDGNHRLLALQEIIKEKHSLEGYVLPFCIILFEDNDSSKQDEKIIFYNINAKAVPIQTEHMLNGIIPSTAPFPFNDDELEKKFGMESLIVRRMEQNHPALIKAIQNNKWATDNTRSLLLHLIQYATRNEKINLQDSLEQDYIAISILKAFEKVSEICGKKTCYSGVVFALTKIFFKSVHGTKDIAKIQCFIEWVKRNDLFTIQPNAFASWEINADNILHYFEKHLASQYHTIFLSRCFEKKYNEIENSIHRAINETNAQFATKITLQRVDQHKDGCAGDIFDRVKKMMSSSGLVIADLSSGKPNVHHEIGLAMGMKKPIILLHRGLDKRQLNNHIPSNISMYDQIRFDTHDYNFLEQEIKKRLINFYSL